MEIPPSYYADAAEAARIDGILALPVDGLDEFKAAAIWDPGVSVGDAAIQLLRASAERDAEVEKILGAIGSGPVRA